MKTRGRILRKTIVIIVMFTLFITVVGYLFMLQPSFGKLPGGERLDRIKHSGRYKNGIFVNRIPTPMAPEGGSTWQTAWRYFTSKAPDNVPKEMLPHVKRDLKKSPLSSSPVLTWFGHSTVLLQVDGKNILTDPQFSEYASPVQGVGPKAFEGTTSYTVDDLPEIDAVLISHDHYDHLDYATIVALNSKTKAFFTPLGVASHLEYWGIPLEKIHEVDWWEKTELSDGLMIVATPSRHFSGRGLSFNKTSWGSYVVMMGRSRFFFSGDSGYDIHFKTIGDNYGPFDIALIETGQYDRLWPYIHMMPEQSVQAAVDLKAKRYIPVHWSKFPLALHSWRDPVTRATIKAKSLSVTIVTPMIGERTVVDSVNVSEKWWVDLN